MAERLCRSGYHGLIEDEIAAMERGEKAALEQIKAWMDSGEARRRFYASAIEETQATRAWDERCQTPLFVRVGYPTGQFGALAVRDLDAASYRGVFSTMRQHQTGCSWPALLVVGQLRADRSRIEKAANAKDRIIVRTVSEIEALRPADLNALTPPVSLLPRPHWLPIETGDY
jgi:hypothetical protein